MHYSTTPSVTSSLPSAAGSAIFPSLFSASHHHLLSFVTLNLLILRPITRPVPQRNEWFIDVPSLRSHQQTSIQLTPPQSRNHPSVPTSIPYSLNPAGRSPSPAGSPTPFPGLSRAQSPLVSCLVPAQATTWSPQPPSHTSSHTFGNSPFFGDFDCEAEFSGLDHQRKNSVILDPPNPNDGNPDVKDDNSVAKEGDTAQIKSQGGPFTDEQVTEIRGIVESMNRELERKVKEWDRPLESVMQIGNLAISTRERRSAGNPWNVYQASYEKDPSQTVPITNSNAWKKKSKELVDQHNASKAAQAFDIALSLATMGKVIKQTTKRWKDYLKWMATMNIHGFYGIVEILTDWPSKGKKKQAKKLGPERTAEAERSWKREVRDVMCAFNRSGHASLHLLSSSVLPSGSCPSVLPPLVPALPAPPVPAPLVPAPLVPALPVPSAPASVPNPARPRTPTPTPTSLEPGSPRAPTYSPVTPRNPLIVRDPLVVCDPLVICDPLVVRNPLVIRDPLVVHDPLIVHDPLAVCHLLFIVCHLPLVCHSLPAVRCFATSPCLPLAMPGPTIAGHLLPAPLHLLFVSPPLLLIGPGLPLVKVRPSTLATPKEGQDHPWSHQGGHEWCNENCQGDDLGSWEGNGSHQAPEHPKSLSARAMAASGMIPAWRPSLSPSQEYARPGPSQLHRRSQTLPLSSGLPPSRQDPPLPPQPEATPLLSRLGPAPMPFPQGSVAPTASVAPKCLRLAQWYALDIVGVDGQEDPLTWVHQNSHLGVLAARRVKPIQKKGAMYHMYLLFKDVAKQDSCRSILVSSCGGKTLLPFLYTDTLVNCFGVTEVRYMQEVYINAISTAEIQELLAVGPCLRDSPVMRS
ncbi:hypothetical protein BS47DRAFT_1396111 [Hydnum rufescens UP504]|uniref:Uncharacterized protein n=1 Tax=Hydnum rufescens UP504 TaxID=1448309 RepID=A0A9P6AQY0_9AGAM|nr:hypothetical protein BS47DRAFT_1396111 [Hydnum rufescens UP504]